jgi:hypothetical protein
VPSENFNTVLYDGTSANHAITGLGFQPDLVWIKDRGNAEQHVLNDSTRGAGNDLSSNTNGAQANRPTGFVSFDSNGFTLGTDGGGIVNDSTRGPYVAWCWKANGGTTSSNTDGTITSTVQANTQAGFSIVEYTGTGINSTVGHGLGATPKIVIIKKTSTTDNWQVSISNITGVQGQRVFFNLNQGISTDVNRETAFPSSTLLSVGGQDCAGSTDYIAYCFAEKTGYSKFGTYTGNGSDNGPIINTGFEPAFVMIKRTDSADNWSITDNKRTTSNPRDLGLFPNLSSQELQGGYTVNYLSNGFQIATSGAGVNVNGGTFLYIAFAADPSTAPVLADSFNVSLWTGDGSTNRLIQGLGFQPSFVWLKSRSSSSWHHFLQDQIRTAPYFLGSQSTNAEATTLPNIVSSFDSDGFTIQNNGNSNNPGDTWVSWSWKADSTPTINTDGDITSVVSANPDAGFSIVSFTKTNGNAETIGHGLNAIPELIIMKARGAAGDWQVYSVTIGNTKRLNLNLTAAQSTSGIWNNTTPTDTVFTTTFNPAASIIAYCFHSVDGFSKIGSYTGTGSTGNSVNVGFQPDYVMQKKTGNSGSWNIIDSKRGDDNYLSANLINAEASMTAGSFVLTSTGFTLNNSFSEWNASGETYIYMAFKENNTARDLNFLLVAGGGGAGQSVAPVPFSSFGKGGAGGGAGGLRTSYGSTSGGGSTAESGLSLTAGTYTITVGSGGSGGSGGGSASSGTNSVILTPDSTSIISTGGGYGGGYDNGLGGVGGSGGGAASKDNGTFPNRGIGTAGQGFDGGYGFTWYDSSVPVTIDGGGGGGGAASRGLPSSNVQSTRQDSSGGDGLAVSVTGSSVTYAAGGRGTQGSPNNNGSGWTGNANTGDGGQGNYNSSGGAGASGVVVLRMPTASYSGTTTGSPTVTTDGSDTILTYTGSGTYVHS